MDFVPWGAYAKELGRVVGDDKRALSSCHHDILWFVFGCSVGVATDEVIRCDQFAKLLLPTSQHVGWASPTAFCASHFRFVARWAVGVEEFMAKHAVHGLGLRRQVSGPPPSSGPPHPFHHSRRLELRPGLPRELQPNRSLLDVVEVCVRRPLSLLGGPRSQRSTRNTW